MVSGHIRSLMVFFFQEYEEILRQGGRVNLRQKKRGTNEEKNLMRGKMASRRGKTNV